MFCFFYIKKIINFIYCISFLLDYIILFFFNFITKIAMAIGGGCAGWMLDYYHYDAGNITASAINGINVLMTLFPGAMFALSALFVACYSLDEKTYRDIVQKISLRKQNAL